MKKIKLLIGVLFIALNLFISTPIFAHVTIKPSQVNAAAFQTFTVSVPVEKDMPTNGLRLIIPEGLKHVTPNVKPGWIINTKKTDQEADDVIMEISWTGGLIPPGQRDEFLFSAQVPTEETTIPWKAYQTYQDGTVVSWDMDPSSEEKKENFGPYSKTQIIDDLKSSSQTPTNENNTISQDKNALFLSGIALMISVLALTINFKRK